MFLGRFQLGETVPLSVLCRTTNGTPTLPTQAPVAVVVSDTAHVLAARMPIQDRYGTTAFFLYPLFLDGRFATGVYRVAYQYSITVDSVTTPYGDLATFEVVGGGHTDGAGLGLYFYRRPGANFLLEATESGRLIRKRNPRV